MLALWSVKGGSGVSVTAAALALSVARRGAEVLLVDLVGDQPLVLGLADCDRPGVSEWITAGDEVPADGLARMEVDVAPGLRLLPRGAPAPHSSDRRRLLASLLGSDARVVVVDCGLVVAPETARTPGAVHGISGDAPPRGGSAAVPPMVGSTATEVITAAPRSLLVIRPCYLALRHALTSPLRPTGLVVMDEPGRSLGARDVAEVLGVPVVAEVPVESATARAVDAGLLVARLPRGLARAVEGAA